jgi:urease accessory protein
MKTFFGKLITTLCIVILYPSLAFAHHPLAGQKMETFFQGFLSGIGHPILGFDHLFFIIGIGIICLLAKKMVLGPLNFIIGMILGLFLIITGYNLFIVEFVIAASLFLIGLFIVSGKTVNFKFISASLIIVGLFHGWAFGETIIGQENTEQSVISGYLLGLSLIIWAISIISSLIYKKLYNVFDPNDVKLKISGGIIAGMGMFILLENIETKVFSLLI